MSSISFTIDQAGRLLLTGSGRRTIQLRFTVQGPVVLHAMVESVCLPWDSYGSLRWVVDGPPRDGWVITHFSSGRAGAFGIAVQVSGVLDTHCQEIYSATMTRWRRFHRWGGTGTLTGHALPLVPSVTAFAARERERIALDALASVLATRAELRPLLEEPSRMTRLASDLARLPPPLTAPIIIGREATDISFAMQRVGLVHRFGRPLSRRDIPPLAEAVERTSAQLECNPHRAGRRTKKDLVERIVRRDFYEVEPWPFGALVS